MAVIDISRPRSERDGTLDSAIFNGRLGPAGTVYSAIRSAQSNFQRWLDSSDHFQFDDRRKHAKTLVCVLISATPLVWPLVLPRLKAALPEGDVCLVLFGHRDDFIADLCAREGWSYLATSTSDASLAQNICFTLHSHAELIVKIDDDMFVLKDTISSLIQQFQIIKADGVVNPGFLAPLIPVNGFSYRHTLDMLGLLDDYEARFGRAAIGGSGLAIHDNPEAAVWTWKHTGPLEDTFKKFNNLAPRTLFCPIRYNTGLIVFERTFWEEIGRFPVLRRRMMFGIQTDGADELHLCATAMTGSRPAIVTTATVAGHFAFPKQVDAMLRLIAEQPELFTLPQPGKPPDQAKLLSMPTPNGRLYGKHDL